MWEHRGVTNVYFTLSSLADEEETQAGDTLLMFYAGLSQQYICVGEGTFVII